MKNGKVSMKDVNGKIVEVKVGFSWTTLFFSLFPDLLRGNLKPALGFFVVYVLLNTMLIAGNVDEVVTSLILLVPTFIYASMRNKKLIEYYFSKGYSFVGDIDKGELDTFMGYTVNTNKIITE